MQNRQFCPKCDSYDGYGVCFAPLRCHPAGEHPVNAKCRRGISPPLGGVSIHPCGQKNPPIFPTAFTGCNTLHFALQSRVPDVPSGLPYGWAYALLILRFPLRIKECRRDGYGFYEGVSPKYRHNRHDRHAPKTGRAALRISLQALSSVRTAAMLCGL